MTRRALLGGAATVAEAARRKAPGSGDWLLAPSQAGGTLTSFEISKDVRLSVPEKSIEESFRIAARLVEDIRRLAYQHYGKDGLLAVSDGKNGPQHGYDPRDFHFGPKCAAYLYGHDAQFSNEMGRRIFQDQSDPADGHLRWDYPRGQTAIHFAQTAKYWSDFVTYTEQNALVAENWGRVLQTIKWCMAAYDPNGEGLIEHGVNHPDHFWALLVGEPENFPQVNNCTRDVVVVASMDVCELLHVMGAHSAAQGLAGSDWLQSHAAKMHEVIETKAWDPDAGYYYLLYRRQEKKWQHSILRLNEESRELDATQYYSSLISGNYARAVKVAGYARKLLLEDGLFPMPLQYPPYSWICKNYGGADTFIEGGCWEESYYNCVRSWSECKMLDAVYEAVRRRSEAHVRDGQCIEWYTQTKGIGRGRDRYGITAAAHVSAIIEGLFGITPAKIGFDEINIRPNLPAKWADQTSTVRVTLPNSGFLEYSHVYDTAKKTVTLKVLTNKQRSGHFRVFAPMPVVGVNWNSTKTLWDSAQLASGGFLVFLDRPFQEGQLEIMMTPRS